MCCIAYIRDGFLVFTFVSRIATESLAGKTVRGGGARCLALRREYTRVYAMYAHINVYKQHDACRVYVYTTSPDTATYGNCAK